MTKDLTISEITARLVAIHAALVDKIDCLPYTEPVLSVGQCGNISVGVYTTNDCSRASWIRADSARECLDKADAFVAALPDPATAKVQGFQKNLAALIDEGNSLNMPAVVMALLSDSMAATAENLLTYGGVKV